MKNAKAQEIIRKSENEVREAQERINKIMWSYREVIGNLTNLTYSLGKMANLFNNVEKLYVQDYSKHTSGDGGDEYCIKEINISEIKNYYNVNCAFYISKYDLVNLPSKDWETFDNEIYWLGDFDGNGTGAGQLLYYLAGIDCSGDMTYFNDKYNALFPKQKGEGMHF